MNNFEEQKKKVDESWKETIKKEEDAQQGHPQEKAEYPQEINLELFLSGLMIEGLVALGEIENPVAKKTETNLDQARYIIDIISMLAEKTKNNVTPEEAKAVEHILYELRIRYVAKSK